MPAYIGKEREIMQPQIWHKSYVPQVPHQIELENIAMPEFLAGNAKKFPDRTALIFMGKKISYGELDQEVSKMASSLRRLGLKPGDRVSLLLPNIPQVVIAYYGVWRAGGVPVPNNPLYTDRELAHQFNISESTILISLDLLTPRMLALQPETRIRHIISCHINDYLPFPLKTLFPWIKRNMYHRFEPKDGFHRYRDLIAGASLDFTPVRPDMNDLALIPFTGGTTGVSKGVELTHANISHMSQLMRAWFYDWKDSPEVELGIFPFFHLAGFTAVMNMSIINGWTDVLVPKPEPKVVLDMMLKYKPGVIPAVPTIYAGLLKLPEIDRTDLSFVKGFFSGAAPLALETISALKKAAGADIVEGFGMTESAALVTVTPWRGRLKPGSVGVPLPNTEVRIMDVETGENEAPIGEEGEVVFRGPQMCRGYYRMPEETAESIRNGWFYTGDIGRMDEDGYLYIVDRKKDMIIAGGFNIFPREIDEVLYEHPAVNEACSFGVPDPYRGETVKACVVLNPGCELTAEELDAHCRERLTAYKVPKLYEFMDDLPKSAIGKILRRELRARESAKTS